MGGGWGGRADADGENATVSMCQGGVQNAPVELQEIYYPVIIEHHRLREAAAARENFVAGWVSRSPCELLCDAFVNINVERHVGTARGVCLAANAASRQKRWSNKTPMIRVMAHQAAQLSVEEEWQRNFFYRGRRRLRPGPRTAARANRAGPAAWLCPRNECIRGEHEYPTRI